MTDQQQVAISKAWFDDMQRYSDGYLEMMREIERQLTEAGLTLHIQPGGRFWIHSDGHEWAGNHTGLIRQLVQEAMWHYAKANQEEKP